MPQSSITFSPTFRDIRGRFARADANMLRNKQNAVRILGARWVEIAREEAPERTGKFRESIRFHVFARNTGDKAKTEVGFTTSSKQPLGRWITEGTRPHIIRAKKKNFLRFFWPRMGKIVFFHSVNHPGTRANPYLDRAYIRWIQDMEKEIEAVADKFIIDVVSK